MSNQANPRYSMTSMSLEGKNALVTGSTTGIGRAIAEGLTQAGARVFVNGRNREQGKEVARECGGTYIHADLAHPDDVASLANQLSARVGALDVLVNNAGMEQGATLENLTGDVLRSTFEVNLFAPIELTRALLPLLRAARSASIINVTSIHDHVPYSGNSAYASSKAALAMFTRVLAIELGPEGIRVNALAPGAVETNLNKEVLDEIGRDHFRELIPLGRVGRVDEMVGPAIFLASEMSSYVTGATIVADGAYSHHLVRYRSHALSGPEGHDDTT